MSDAKSFRYPIWCRGDLDGFFGLMVDNLVQVLLIILLCTLYVGMSVELISTRILPGVAISLLIGNLFYGAQAHYVARRDRNPNCTALPYGINTPSVFAFALFVMAPIYKIYEGELGADHASRLAWKAGMLACMVSGVIEFLAAFFAERLRRVTPRAALLGVLAALGITFIATDFSFQIYTRPLIGVFPLGILLLAYFAKYRFPARLPGGFIAIMVGTLIAWGMSTPLYLNWFGGTAPQSFEELRASLDKVGWIMPVFRGSELMEVLSRPELLLLFLTVSVPMGVINAIGSLQNIESAEAGGDRFSTGPSLAVNGIGTIGAALFGSCFPTTIYIGHPAWKALGARSGYSILNGAFFTVCFLFGWGVFLKEFIPIEAGAAIVVYIGIIITAQAFQATPRAHAPAVAFALFPALAALLVVKMPLLMGDAGASRTLAEMVTSIGPATAEPTLPGMIALAGANSSWLLTTLLLTAMGACLIDRRYKAAAIWCGIAAVLTALGLLHAYRLEDNVIHEYFLWQKPVEVAVAEAPPEAPGPILLDTATLAATMPTSSPAVESAPATQAVSGSMHYAYRAFPIAIGYGLTTILLALIAVRARKKDQSAALAAESPPDESKIQNTE
ncbi:MAG: NCS2 family permease [Phycisphaerae bacterium]|nr:NCS2 family permease [Phycisphaerae bacterium]